MKNRLIPCVLACLMIFLVGCNGNTAKEAAQEITKTETSFPAGIAGKFFIAYAPIESEKFLSMPKELARKYEEKFKYPERFYKSLDGIEAKPYKPVSKDMER